MFPCSHCGNQLPDGATFCNQCWKTVDSGVDATSVQTGRDGFTMPGPAAAPDAGSSDHTSIAPPPGPTFDPPVPPNPEPTSAWAASPPPPSAAPASPWDPQPQAWGGQPGQWGNQPAPWGAPPSPPPGGYGYGAGGYAPPPYGVSGYYGSPAKKTNGLAIASLICSVAGLLTCITAVVGIVLGHISLSQIKRDGSEGRGLAIAGLVIGYLITFGIIALVVVAIMTDTSSGY